MRIKFKKLLSTVLALILVLTAAAAILPAAPAYAVTQAEINALKQQQQGLKTQENGLQSTINSLKSQQTTTYELKAALDEKNAITLQQIMNLNEQIELHEELIAQKTEEVKAAQEVADEQLRRYKLRLRNMEENGRFGYIEVLFGAGSIGEFLSLIDDIGDIMKSDKALEQAYREAVEELKTLKSEYEEAQKELKDKKVELEALSKQLQEDIAEATAVINSLQSDINANSAVLADLAKQDKALQTQIYNKLAELNAQQKAEQQSKPSSGGSSSGGSSSGGSSSGGSTSAGNGRLTVWPSNSTYITSVQGNRVHPITGKTGTHGGTDIGASYGSAIYAAGSGTVVTAYNDSGYNGGYGNYCIINHGNGVQTLYAHMSVCSVKSGQTVSAGQVIGYVGSTGASTGPHLHFEVYVNGVRKDPQSFYPGISFSYSPTAWGG
ncbi:MAG: peptidoglycan DD-metalloendopeptidase family protein [Oscillospiraceae bacterium]|nr:peptidoglycan DD-metalloendopeptidase family protein [Oscillospiraceae bacterium]